MTWRSKRRYLFRGLFGELLKESSSVSSVPDEFSESEQVRLKVSQDELRQSSSRSCLYGDHKASSGLFEQSGAGSSRSWWLGGVMAKLLQQDDNAADHERILAWSRCVCGFEVLASDRKASGVCIYCWPGPTSWSVFVQNLVKTRQT